MRLVVFFVALSLWGCAERRRLAPPPPAPPVADDTPVYRGHYAVAEDWPTPPDLAPTQHEVAALDAGQVVQQTQGSWELHRIHPEDALPALPGRVVGVLFSSSEAWGDVLGHRAEQVAPAPRFGFSTAGSRMMALYFASDGRGANFLEGWKVRVGPPAAPRQLRFDAAMFDAEVGAAFGLGRKAQLVELEVNAGAGSPGSDLHFVATKGRVVDGTERYPGRVDELLRLLRQRFDQLLTTERSTADAAMAEWAAEIRRGNEQLTILPNDEAVGAHPTWLPDAQRLDVLFYWRAIATARGPRVSQPQRCVPRSGGAPWNPCEPIAVPRESNLGYDFAVRFTLSMDGRLHTETTFPIRRFTPGLRN